MTSNGIENLFYFFICRLLLHFQRDVFNQSRFDFAMVLILRVVVI